MHASNAVADLGGAQQGPPPPKIWSTVCLFFNKAQIAQNPESFHAGPQP